MNNSKFAPKGRRGLPDQLRNFGRHLVYSEGTRTEPYYVQNIKECIAGEFKVRTNDIEIIHGNKNRTLNTVALANYAINDVRNRIASGETVDHVWIFYDKDSFSKTNFINAYNLINSLNTTKNDEDVPCDNNGTAWHSLPSNQCFELFLISYFSYQTSALNRTQYASMIDTNINKVIPSFNYSKSVKDIHSTILKANGTINNAIRNGKKMEKANGLENPSSKAYQFLEYFKRYLEK